MKLAGRLAGVTALCAATFALTGLLGAPAASAHPLGNFTVNRYSGFDLRPGRVQITYVVDMAEIPTFQAMPQIDANGDGTATAAEKQAWADRTAPQLVAELMLAVDGHKVPLIVAGDTMRFRSGQAGLPILYFRALLTGSIPSSGSVQYQDQNFADRIGWKEITARSEAGVALFDSTLKAVSISDELQSYPIDLLSSPLDQRSATFSFHPGKPAPVGGRQVIGSRTSGAPIASGRSFAALVRWKLTPALLAFSLALALLFGALHALGPGHGKTITAAYLVGSGARRRQAFLIGAAVSIMHTASVLALGLVALVLSKTFPADRVYPWLTLLTGLVALGLGAGLAAVRLRARRAGLDAWHGHTHLPEGPAGGAEGHDAHVHGHHLRSTHQHEGHRGAFGDAAEGGGVMLLDRQDSIELERRPAGPSRGAPLTKPISSRGLLALAVAGGILPSPTALVVLTGAIYAHRVGYGLALIGAFSVGLATALMGVGMAAIRVRSMVSSRLTGRMAGLLPVLSALVIVAFGAFFAARGALQLA